MEILGKGISHLRKVDQIGQEENVGRPMNVKLDTGALRDLGINVETGVSTVVGDQIAVSKYLTYEAGGVISPIILLNDQFSLEDSSLSPMRIPLVFWLTISKCTLRPSFVFEAEIVI